MPEWIGESHNTWSDPPHFKWDYRFPPGTRKSIPIHKFKTIYKWLKDQGVEFKQSLPEAIKAMQATTAPKGEFGCDLCLNYNYYYELQVWFPSPEFDQIAMRFKLTWVGA